MAVIRNCGLIHTEALQANPAKPTTCWKDQTTTPGIPSSQIRTETGTTNFKHKLLYANCQFQHFQILFNHLEQLFILCITDLLILFQGTVDLEKTDR